MVADERDLIGVRTDTRRERVYLYRLQISPDTVRRLFVSYIERTADLAARPEFYNTLTNNCTTSILGRANAVSPAIAYSWKILASGHAAEYAYELGLLGSQLSFDDLRRRSRVHRPADAAIGHEFLDRGPTRSMIDLAPEPSTKPPWRMTSRRSRSAKNWAAPVQDARRPSSQLAF